MDAPLPRNRSRELEDGRPSLHELDTFLHAADMDERLTAQFLRIPRPEREITLRRERFEFRGLIEHCVPVAQAEAQLSRAVDRDDLRMRPRRTSDSQGLVASAQRLVGIASERQ